MSKKFEQRQRQRFEQRQRDEAAARKAEKEAEVHGLSNSSHYVVDETGVTVEFKVFTEKFKEASVKAGRTLEEFAKQAQEALSKIDWSKSQLSWIEEHQSRYYKNLVDPPVGKKEPEMDVDDEALLPQASETAIGCMYVVYRDEGALPQVEKVEPENVSIRQRRAPCLYDMSEDFQKAEFEPWLVVDYLIGEDYDPCTIIVDHGSDYQVIAYRRCGYDGVPYQDGWVGEMVPEEYAEKQPARRRRRPGVSVRYQDFMSVMYTDEDGEEIWER